MATRPDIYLNAAVLLSEELFGYDGCCYAITLARRRMGNSVASMYDDSKPLTDFSDLFKADAVRVTGYTWHWMGLLRDQESAERRINAMLLMWAMAKHGDL